MEIWNYIGQTENYHYWCLNGLEIYNCTKEFASPTTLAGDYNLDSLRKLKNDNLGHITKAYSEMPSNKW